MSCNYNKPKLHYVRGRNNTSCGGYSPLEGCTSRQKNEGDQMVIFWVFGAGSRDRME